MARGRRPGRLTRRVAVVSRPRLDDAFRPEPGSAAAVRGREPARRRPAGPSVATEAAALEDDLSPWPERGAVDVAHPPPSSPRPRAPSRTLCGWRPSTGNHVTSDEFKVGLAELQTEMAVLDARLSTQIVERQDPVSAAAPDLSPAAETSQVVGRERA